MDVGDPSNLERIRWMFGGEVDVLRRVVTASAHTDADVRGALRELDQRYGYVADPHTAIAYLGSVDVITGNAEVHAQFLATAHPAKFGDAVEPAIGRAVPVPAPLAEAMGRPRLVVHIAPELAELAALL
jgi:threonine synthase